MMEMVSSRSVASWCIFAIGSIFALAAIEIVHESASDTLNPFVPLIIAAFLFTAGYRVRTYEAESEEEIELSEDFE